MYYACECPIILLIKLKLQPVILKIMIGLSPRILPYTVRTVLQIANLINAEIDKSLIDGPVFKTVVKNVEWNVINVGLCCLNSIYYS